MSSLSEKDRQSFDRDGYLIFDPGLDNQLLDEIRAFHDDIWSENPRVTPAVIDHGRTQDAWQDCDAIRQVATHPHILDVLKTLYGRRPLPFQTLNFPRGTQQPTHSDSIHFNCEPFGLMCGVWVALEDIGPDQGPLIYYPGSHQDAFIDFDKVGVPADPKNYRHYEQHIRDVVEQRGYVAELGLIPRGHAIIWSANLLHGGSAQTDRSRSRHSQVTHYYLEGAKPWRPMFSAEERHYFAPRWIPATRPGAPQTLLQRLEHLSRAVPHRVRRLLR